MRNHRITAFAVGLATAAGLITGCSSDAGKAEKITPAVVDTIADSKLKQVTLTPDAAERISLALGEITAGTGDETVIPYGAVVYDAEGLSWAYVSRSDNVFVREEITIDRIIDDKAYLTSGPDVGTSVAVVGVAELFGAETGIGK